MNKSTIFGLVLTTVAAASFAPASHAGRSTSDLAGICKAEAAGHYGADGQSVRVKFKGISGPRQSKLVRLQVFPDGGDSFLAICELDAGSGEVISIERQS